MKNKKQFGTPYHVAEVTCFWDGCDLRGKGTYFYENLIEVKDIEITGRE